MRDPGFSIRDMAARCGMTAHTLRYYERVGLIHPVSRARNGHRRYSGADEAWLKFIHQLRSADMPIRILQQYAALHADGAQAAVNILEEQRTRIANQIEVLEQAHAVLTRKIKESRGANEHRERLAASTVERQVAPAHQETV